jgi:regulator of protease activity HflC (stomatin/prohibitin superfamily)
MFDKLIEFFLNILDLFRFWAVVKEGNRAVIYTLGKPTRTVGPQDGIRGTGLHLKWPFWIELEEDTSIREEIACFAGQDLQTKDDKKVRVSGAFTYAVVPEKVVIWQTTLGDEGTALPTALRSAIAETIIRRDLADLLEVDELKGLRQEILDRARKALNSYGCRITDFKWVERTEARTYRLITGD